MLYIEGEPGVAGKPTNRAITVKNKESARVPLGVRRPTGGDATDVVMRIIEDAKLNPMSDEKLAAENTSLWRMALGRRRKLGLRNATSRA